jgi:hypothetical protein
MPTIEQYAADLYQEVLVKCADDASCEAREDAFTEYALEQLNDHNEIDTAEVIRPASRWVKTKSHPPLPSAKVNAWSLSSDGGMLDLFVTLFHGEGEKYSVSKSDAIKHFEFLQGFLQRAFAGDLSVSKDNDAFELIEKIKESALDLLKIRLFFITNGIVRESVSDVISSYVFENISVEHQLWDLVQLSRLKPGEANSIDLDFGKLQNKPLPCIFTEDATGEYKTFLAYVPAPLIGKIYNEFGQRLLERNVRSFLSVKNSVNKGIQETLKEQPERFLAYNNGLCCTAGEIEADCHSDGLGLIRKLTDFQIVNGGQTTASIAHAIKEKIDVRNVVVQMKLTVVSKKESIEEIVPLISRYANSQSKVLTADFSANGNFHKLLEQTSRQYWAPGQSKLERGTHWYYERARGSYEVDKSKLSNAQKKIFEQENPRHQKFSKTDLAKFELSWMGFPYIVCKGNQKNFEAYAERIEEDGEPDVTPDYFQQLVARAIFFKWTEKIVTKLDLGGHRANIVAYTISWLAEKSDFSIDLDRIWEMQKLPNELCEAIKIVAIAARDHFDATPPLGKPFNANISENTKKKECWNYFRDKRIHLPTSWESCFSSKKFLSFKSNAESLAAMWDDVRQYFITSDKTIKALEIYTNKKWPLKSTTDSVVKYASKTYEEMVAQKGVGEKKMKLIIEFFSAAK